MIYIIKIEMGKIMRNTNAYALLCLLSRKPMNGYLMKQWVDNVLRHFWKTSYGQIYPTMNKFLEEGLVTVEKRENERGPSSKYYKITQKGLDELKEWMMEDSYDFNYNDESLLKFYFSSMLPLDTVIKKAQKTVEFHEEILEGYNTDESEMNKVGDPTREQLMTYLSVKKGIYLNEARAKWAQDCIKTLNWFKEKEQKKEEENEN